MYLVTSAPVESSTADPEDIPSSNTTTTTTGKPNPLVLVIAGVIATLSIVAFVLRYYVRRRRLLARRNAYGLSNIAGQSEETIDARAHVQLYSVWKQDRILNLEVKLGKEEEDVPTNNWEAKVCVFCLEEIQDHELIRGLDCTHVFHESCAHQWDAKVKHKLTCPVCRCSYLH